MNQKSISVNGIKVFLNRSLADVTYTRTGGKTDYLAFPDNISQVKTMTGWARQHQIPLLVLGNASNLIIRDGGVRGLTLILTRLNHLECIGNQIQAESGAAIIDVARTAQQHHLGGLAFAAGIPGSVGGAVYMNAGAYGGNTSQVVKSVRVLTAGGQIKTLNRQQLHFGYRHSILQEWDNVCVLQVTFVLYSANPDHIQAQMDDFNAQRAAKQPLDFPSCGSVFKRPRGHYAGQLIHDSHLQGYQAGGAMVSRIHAGFIVNVDHASATDYLNVIHHVQKQVLKDSNVHLHTEVRVIGE